MTTARRQGRRGWHGRRTGRIPAWLLLAAIQASILAVLLLSGFTFYQADRLGYFVPDAPADPPTHLFQWRPAP